MSSAATEHGTRPLLQSTVDRHIPRQRSSAGHWWEQYEDPENAQPYWVNTTTGEYFHVGQQSSSSSLAATVNRCLASGSVTDELGAATEHTEVFVSVQRSTQSYVLGAATEHTDECPHSVATLAHECDMTVAEDTGAGSADERPVIVLPWQPPSYPWRSRGLDEIIQCCTDEMKWKALKNFSMCSTALYPALSDLPWSLIMHQVVQMAALEVGSLPLSATEQLTWSLTMWQETVQKAGLDTIKGLQQYLLQWKRDDSVVEAWLDGTLTCSPSTADIGGWLADYMHSLFTFLTEQGKPNMKYVVVPNKDYKSLCVLLDVWCKSHAKAVCDRNPEKLGNILEQLCWHAYEHRQGVVILAIIWNTVNRCLASGAATEHILDSVTDELGAATEHTPAPPPQPVLYDFAIGQTLSKRSGSRLRSELLKPLIAEYVGQHVEGRDIEIDLTTQRPYPWQEVMAGQGLPRGLRVVRCTARFFSEEADSNTEPKFEPRLDVVLYLDDGTYARYHPGIKLIYSNHPPTGAIVQRRQLRRKNPLPCLHAGS